MLAIILRNGNILRSARLSTKRSGEKFVWKATHHFSMNLVPMVNTGVELRFKSVPLRPMSVELSTSIWAVTSFVEAFGGSRLEAILLQKKVRLRPPLCLDSPVTCCAFWTEKKEEEKKRWWKGNVYTFWKLFYFLHDRYFILFV